MQCKFIWSIVLDVKCTPIIALDTDILYKMQCSMQSLKHASLRCLKKLVVDWVPAGDLEDATAQEVSELNA